ncbi:MAG: hypothetical protein L6R43_12120, partial [Planctomycetes bacterium]|nr:hypothetical protein [Planctomycetota bacterium]
PAGTFLSRVAAPVLLELPYHRCTWCCLAGAPESILGAGLLVGAAMCAGWALLVRVGGPGEGGGGGGGEPAGPSPLRPLLGAASFGFLASGAMAAVIAGMS